MAKRYDEAALYNPIIENWTLANEAYTHGFT
jgi:phosphoribosylformylglycinamidine (FGAM) synthase PurS component